MQKIRFEITHTQPEKSAEALAIKLAEAFNNVALFERQVVDFKQCALEEKRKARDCQIILSNLTQWRAQLKQDRENGVERKISRMEPMLSYDPEALAEEIVKSKTDSETYTETADEFRLKAGSCRKEIIKLQTEIREINQQIKK